MPIPRVLAKVMPSIYRPLFGSSVDRISLASAIDRTAQYVLPASRLQTRPVKAVEFKSTCSLSDLATWR
jgi:hypothetical protein